MFLEQIWRFVLYVIFTWNIPGAGVASQIAETLLPATCIVSLCHYSSASKCCTRLLVNINFSLHVLAHITFVLFLNLSSSGSCNVLCEKDYTSSLKFLHQKVPGFFFQTRFHSGYSTFFPQLVFVVCFPLTNLIS